MDTDKFTSGLFGILGAGIMLKSADMTLDMIGGGSKKKKKKKSKWGLI